MSAYYAAHIRELRATTKKFELELELAQNLLKSLSLLITLKKFELEELGELARKLYKNPSLSSGLKLKLSSKLKLDPTNMVLNGPISPTMIPKCS